MALDKSRTSVGVKVLIIVLIIAFVSLFMYTGIAGIFDLFKPGTTSSASSTVDTVAELAARNQPSIDAIKKAVASNPASYTLQVSLADSYYNWAQELAQPASGQSQLTTGAMMAAFQEWALAKSAYDAASKIATGMDAPVQTDRSYAAYASGDATSALQIAKAVTEKTPNFAQAWAHLGVYYEATGKSALAIPAYKKYLALDPKGQAVSYVQGRLKALSNPTSTFKSP